MTSRPEAQAVLLTEESIRAVLSSVERSGRWEPADDIQIDAICGAVKLDFSRADLPASGEIEMNVRAICGSVEITVPDGAEVVLDGTPVLGSIEQKLRGPDTDAPSRPSAEGERPTFNIVALAVCGSIEIDGR